MVAICKIKEINMMHRFVLAGCLLSAIMLQTALFGGECPFRNKGTSVRQGDSILHERLSACGCGGGGGGGQNEEIPPDKTH